jgi:hypothetical protein
MQKVVDTEHLVLLVNLGMRVLSHRVMTVVGLLLNAGITGWAISSESWVRLAGAALFAVTSWCVINLQSKESP